MLAVSHAVQTYHYYGLINLQRVEVPFVKQSFSKNGYVLINAFVMNNLF